jgi:hypothetical protein
MFRHSWSLHGGIEMSVEVDGVTLGVLDEELKSTSVHVLPESENVMLLLSLLHLESEFLVSHSVGPSVVHDSLGSIESVVREVKVSTIVGSSEESVGIISWGNEDSVGLEEELVGLPFWVGKLSSPSVHEGVSVWVVHVDGGEDLVWDVLAVLEIESIVPFELVSTVWSVVSKVVWESTGFGTWGSSVVEEDLETLLHLSEWLSLSGVNELLEGVLVFLQVLLGLLGILIVFTSSGLSLLLVSSESFKIFSKFINLLLEHVPHLLLVSKLDSALRELTVVLAFGSSHLVKGFLGISDILLVLTIIGSGSVDGVSELDDLGLVSHGLIQLLESLNVVLPGVDHVSIEWLDLSDLSEGGGRGLHEGFHLGLTVGDFLEVQPGGLINVESIEGLSLDQLHEGAGLEVGGDSIEAVAVLLRSNVLVGA